jgi:hypothetical protein
VSLRLPRHPSTHGTAEQCATSLASIWRGYQGQEAASYFSPGAMMQWAGVKHRDTHEPTPHLAKYGMSGAYRGEELLQARPIEEAIAAEQRVNAKR